ncbi:phage tail tape measure protein [Gilvimarinus japonicus]|uniref:Phage tail tape measure protein n=1 Tax=Gilvimarinus japonicus TaxID=1796469 RepID=A0ABV7HT31_9GAMM
MATRHEKLMYTVSLLDRVSGPSQKIGKNLDRMTQRFQSGMAGIASGSAGLFSTGYALKAIMAPAVEMDRAIGELASLGVADSALKKLEKTALRFTMKYGGSATDIVRSSYDIQSAISGLTDNELARFTDRSALLAKATKSNAGTITDYMGTMYGVFKTQANAMGKSQWVDQLTNMTAAGVERFKTTGDKMSSSFSRLGSDATARGVGMAEQMAVLGTLQATMGGEQAATKYQAFLAKVGQAQEKLGMTFTDNQGRMLPVVDILTKLKARFGDMTKTEDLDLLAKAFGGKNGASFIAALAKDIPGLADSIQALDAASNTNKAAQMAQAIADPWEKLSAIVTAARITFGRLLQPVLNPLVNKFSEHLKQLRGAMDRYPNITKLVGKLTLGVLAIVAALSFFSILIGFSKFLMIGWSVVAAVWGGVIFTITAALKAARFAMLLFNLSLYANPVFWVVIGIVALIAAIALLVYKFDSVKSAWKKYVTDPISDSRVFDPMFKTIFNGIEKIKSGWRGFWNLLKMLNPAKLIGKAFNWIVEKWNALPFVDKVEIGDMTVGGIGSGESSGGLVRSRVPTGGLLQDINNADNRRSNYVEKLEVNTTQKVDAWWLDNQLATVGG